MVDLVTMPTVHVMQVTVRCTVGVANMSRNAYTTNVVALHPIDDCEPLHADVAIITRRGGLAARLATQL
jgi:hypothetical protein